MQIENARYADAEKLGIVADVDGVETAIPVCSDNLHYAFIVAQGIAIADYLSPNTEAEHGTEIHA